MNPEKVDRARLNRLSDLPNVGKASVSDLNLIGIRVPTDLIGKDPLIMYYELCSKTGARHDPCVIDIFMSLTSFMSGHPPRPWWDFTEERKQILEGSLTGG